MKTKKIYALLIHFKSSKVINGDVKIFSKGFTARQKLAHTGHFTKDSLPTCRRQFPLQVVFDLFSFRILLIFVQMFTYVIFKEVLKKRNLLVFVRT